MNTITRKKNNNFEMNCMLMLILIWYSIVFVYETAVDDVFWGLDRDMRLEYFIFVVMCWSCLFFVLFFSLNQKRYSQLLTNCCGHPVSFNCMLINDKTKRTTLNVFVFVSFIVCTLHDLTVWFVQVSSVFDCVHKFSSERQWNEIIENKVTN